MRIAALNFTIYCLFGSIFFYPSASIAQQADLLLDDVFLQNNQRPEGSRFSIDLPDGTRCVSENGTPPTVSFFGGHTSRNDREKQETNSRYFGGGYAGGAILTIPLGANTSRNCDVSYNLQIAAQKLELAQVLHDSGILTDEELKEITSNIKELVMAR